MKDLTIIIASRRIDRSIVLMFFWESLHSSSNTVKARYTLENIEPVNCWWTVYRFIYFLPYPYLICLSLWIFTYLDLCRLNVKFRQFFDLELHGTAKILWSWKFEIEIELELDLELRRFERNLRTQWFACYFYQNLPISSLWVIAQHHIFYGRHVLLHSRPSPSECEQHLIPYTYSLSSWKKSALAPDQALYLFFSYHRENLSKN